MVIKPKDYSTTEPSKDDFSPSSGQKNKPHLAWRIVKLKILFIAIFFLIVIIGVGWFASAPRSVILISDYLLQELRDDIAPYRLETSKANVHLDIKHSRLVATLDDIAIKGDGGHILAKLPELRLNLQALPLLAGDVRIHELVVINPNIQLYRQEDGSLSFDFLSDENNNNNHVKTNAYDNTNTDDVDASSVDIANIFNILNILELEKLSLKKAVIKLGSGTKKILWNVPNMLVSIPSKINEDFGFYAEISTEDNLNNNDISNISTLSGLFRLANDLKDVEASMKVEGFSPAMIGDMDWHFSRLKNLDMRFDGTMAMFFSTLSQNSNLRVELSSEGGVLSDNMLFESPLKLSKTSVKAQLTNNFSNLKIDQLDIGFNKGKLSVVGDILLAEGGVGLKLDAKLDSIPIDNLRNVWPIPLAPVTREWVTDNMSVGVISKGNAVINLESKDSNQRPFPDNFIKSSLELNNASVRYKPNFPKVTGVNGVVRFTGHSMKVKASSGKTMNSAELKSGTVEIADFFAKGVPIDINLNVSAKAKDVARFMDKDYLNIAPHIKLDSTKISGDVSGNVLMGFPLYSKGVKKYYFNYDIKTKLDKVSQNGLLDKWDISNFTGEVYAFNDGLKLNGKTGLNAIASEIEIDDQYRPVKKTDYKLKAKLMADQLPLFGVEKPSFLNGMLDADVDIYENKKGSVTNAKLNLKNAAIDLDIIKWKKPVGEEATATFRHHKAGGNEVIEDLQFVSDSLSANGNVIIGSKEGVLRNLQLSSLQFGNNDSAVGYILDGDVEHISLSGKKFDLSPWLDEESSQKTASIEGEESGSLANNPFDFFDKKLINLNLESLNLGENREIRQVNGKIDCSDEVCESVSFSANYPKGDGFKFLINRDNGKRELSLISASASELMNVLDMSKYVRGGKLQYKGTFDDSRQGSLLNARLLITDFNVVKGGILTKLLTVGSLTGLIDTLQGNGIWFKKLSSDIVFHNNKAIIKNGRAFGNVVGITAEGEILPFDSRLKLKGTIVPSYTANSILGKIPLLGDILTGGEGEGIIAMNYSMNGDSKDPDVSVNPLSLLTPGFLRKLFDVLEDGGEEAEKAKVSPAK